MRRVEPLVTAQLYGDAIDILEQAAAIHPRESLPLVRIGQIYLKQHRWLMAEDAFNRALARDPLHPAATAGLAEALLNQDRVDEAQRFWQEAAEVDPQLRGVFTGLGRTYLQQLDFEAARTAFLEQQAHKSDPDALWYLAALTAPTDLSTARNYLEAISSPSPSSTSPIGPANSALGVQENQANPQASQSLMAWRDYLLDILARFDEDSSQVEVAKATGLGLAQVRMWQLAIHALTVAREQSQTDDAEILAFLGLALAQANRPAFDLFEQARQANTDSALPLYLEGIYLREKEALRAAEQSFAQAIALEPKNPAIHVEMGRTKAQQKDLFAAELWFIAAADIADGVQFDLLLAQFYSDYGYRLTEAGIPTIEAVIEAEPTNALAHAILGWMQFQSGAPDGGEAALRQAIQLDPQLIRARYYLARSLEARGEAGAAIAEYKRVIDLDSSDIFRNQALKDLQRLEQGASDLTAQPLD